MTSKNIEDDNMIDNVDNINKKYIDNNSQK